MIYVSLLQQVYTLSYDDFQGYYSITVIELNTCEMETPNAGPAEILLDKKRKLPIGKLCALKSFIL